MFDLILIFLVGILLMFAIYTAIQVLGRFPKRTIHDVTPFLRPAEITEFESLLDPAQETNLKLRMSPAEFTQWQRKRIHLLREYLLRMSHNALVLIEWGNLEAAGAENDTQCIQKGLFAQELVQAATEFRLYSMLALAKLRLWLILPSPFKFLLPSPSLPTLRTLFGIDALGSYQRVRNAATGLSSVYSLDFQNDLIERL